jgi:hypothetical protein
MFALTARESRIEPGEIHDILRNDRRRKVLQYLRRRLEPVTLRNLAERIATYETGSSPPPSNIRRSVYNSLHQTHLPKLDSVGVVHYDKDRKRVRLRDRARELEPYLYVVTRFGISWSSYYRTLGVGGLVAVVASEANVPYVGPVETLLIATLLLVVFGLSTVYQLWTRRWLYLQMLVTDE